MIKLKFPTSQKAWESLNEMFITQFHYDPDIKRYLLNGAELSINDVFVNIENSWVDPEFDFGLLCDYKMQKWATLVRNYVSKKELNLLKYKVNSREEKKQLKYTESILFTNSHGNGKGCLLSATFIKRKEGRIISCVIRASEITKRLLLDLLLIREIGEYVYGKGAEFKVHLLIYNMYQIAEFGALYNMRKDIHTFAKRINQPYTKRVIDRLDYFQKVNIEEVKYKVHQRCVRSLQKTKSGKPLSGNAGLKAKTLKFKKYLL